MNNFKYPLDLDMTLLSQESKSQAGQDLFVVAMTKAKKYGSFLELGAGHPTVSSNTFLLEKNFGYSGVSIDIQDNSKLWSDIRPNSIFYKADAQDFDYSNLGNHIDYLSFDLDDPVLSLQVLQKVINKLEFSVITFEHDIWKKQSINNKLQVNAFNILRQKGYRIVVNNVTIQPDRGTGKNNEPIFFEDWYVNPKYIDQDVIETYKWLTLDNTIKYYPSILF